MAQTEPGVLNTGLTLKSLFDILPVPTTYEFTCLGHVLWNEESLKKKSHEKLLSIRKGYIFRVDIYVSLRMKKVIHSSVLFLFHSRSQVKLCLMPHWFLYKKPKFRNLLCSNDMERTQNIMKGCPFENGTKSMIRIYLEETQLLLHIHPFIWANGGRDSHWTSMAHITESWRGYSDVFFNGQTRLMHTIWTHTRTIVIKDHIDRCT